MKKQTFLTISVSLDLLFIILLAGTFLVNLIQMGRQMESNPTLAIARGVAAIICLLLLMWSEIQHKARMAKERERSEAEKREWDKKKQDYSLDTKEK